MAPPKVVIVGAGFGGLECAKRLANRPVEVTLLDRNNYHLFTPLLYQVASALLNPSDIAHPVRGILRGAKNVHFRLAHVAGVDLDQRLVRDVDGQTFPYDYLVLATGSATNYFGLGSVERVAHGLKDLPEALELRNHVIRCFETAARLPEGEARQEWLRLVVVGGGPTGVEAAGAFSELIRGVLIKDYPDMSLHGVQVVLVEALPSVLTPFAPPLQLHAIQRLRRLGVEVRLNARVLEAGADAVVLAVKGESGGTAQETLRARTLIWAAGVKVAGVVTELGLPRTRSGRLEVDARLRVSGRTEVFAVGDVAAAQHQGKDLAMLSAPAIQEGRYAARAILQDLQKKSPAPFRYFDKGIMATIGRHAAVAQLGPVPLKGVIGWFAWLFVHLYFIIGFRNRLAVLLGWAWNYVFYDRPIRLITAAGRRSEFEPRSP